MSSLNKLLFRFKRKISIPFLLWTRRTSAPGLSGVPIYDVVMLISREIYKDEIMIRSNSMAFSFLLAIFPMLILIFVIIPFLPYKDLMFYYDNLTALLTQFLPIESSKFMLEIIQDLLFNQRTGLLSVSILMAMYFSSNGIMYMMMGFEKQYKDTFKERTYLYRRLVSVFLTGLLGFMFIASVLLIFFSNRLILEISELIGSKFLGELLNTSRWFIVILLIYTIISAIYRFGSNFRMKYGYFSPGATTATVLSILSSLAFSYYVNNFSNYNQIYGSIGALIITMLWLQINSFIILIGFELNASIVMNKFGKLDKT